MGLIGCSLEQRFRDDLCNMGLNLQPALLCVQAPPSRT